MNHPPVGCDVIVVGGGPAGTSSAIVLAEHGLKVTLLERESFPRHRPGETLHPGVQPLLTKLGIDDESLSSSVRHSGHAVSWGEEKKTVQYFGQDDDGPWLGYQLMRDHFDSLLLNKAITLGVRVIQPAHAVDLLHEGGRITGLKTSSENLLARYVIDAGGSAQWLAGKFDLPVESHSRKLLALYGYSQVVGREPDPIPSLVSDRSGWTWTALVQANVYQWTRLWFDYNHFDITYVPESFAQAVPWRNSKGADVTWRLVKHCAGPGYFVVGDACFVLDPSSSHGVLKAIMSGMMAGHCIAKSLNENVPEEGTISAFTKFMHDWFEHDASAMREMYARVDVKI